jgi:hypothetical protein
MDEPGLVKREILPSTVKGHVLVREVWDLSVPGCPMVAFKHGPTYPFARDLDVKAVVRTVMRRVEP